MSLNISLHTVSAVLILDKEGNRLFAKYYKHPTEDATKDSKAGFDSQFQTLAQQQKFEKAIFSKVNKVHQDILLYDNHLVTYKQANEVIFIMVAKMSENESLIYSALANLYESVRILLDYSVDSTTILENFDMVALAIDETVEEGVLMEIDPAVIVSRVTKGPSLEITTHGIEINENTISSAFSFAKRFGERLQQSL